MKTAIFLGGGASAAEGMPVQADIFREYFRFIRKDPSTRNEDMAREITAYFQQLFGLDITTGDIDSLIFPTFEEALGILDLAVRRREALKDFDLENIGPYSNRIGFLRQYLVLLMAAVLNAKMNGVRGIHELLINNLHKMGTLHTTAFLTTNYDILIDNALAAVPGYTLDYGIEFVRNPSVGAADDRGRNLILYKVHGSLNWLFCPACNTIMLTSRDQGVIGLLKDRVHNACEFCQTVLLPVIVPPTFFKDMSNVYLSIVWNKAEALLREVQRIIFCGYSFADADMHIKYLLKRGQTNRLNNERLRIFVVNGHPGKNPHFADKECIRYRRFLGSEIEYTGLSFEEFAGSPASLLTM